MVLGTSAGAGNQTRQQTFYMDAPSLMLQSTLFFKTGPLAERGRWEGRLAGQGAFEICLFPCVGVEDANCSAYLSYEVLGVQTQILTLAWPAPYPPSLPMLPSDPTFNHPCLTLVLVTPGTEQGSLASEARALSSSCITCLHPFPCICAPAWASRLLWEAPQPSPHGVSYPEPCPSQSTCVGGRTPWWAGNS